MNPLEVNWDIPLRIAAVILVALILHFLGYWLIKRMISKVRKMTEKPNGTLAHKAAKAINQASGSKPGRMLAHTTAIAKLLRSVWTIALVVVSFLTVLSILRIPLSPILASAGVGGVIIAFGAQSLIKDYFAGISMILEDQYGVGDQVTIGDVSGVVEDITMRITKIRDGSGTIWYVRNGEILKVGNVTQGYSTGIVDVPVAYDADVTLVTNVLNQVLATVTADNDMADKLLEPPTLLGVESVTATTLTMRIAIKTGANQQYSLVREIRERALTALSDAGVPGPVVIPNA